MSHTMYHAINVVHSLLRVTFDSLYFLKVKQFSFGEEVEGIFKLGITADVRKIKHSNHSI